MTARSISMATGACLLALATACSGPQAGTPAAENPSVADSSPSASAKPQGTSTNLQLGSIEVDAERIVDVAASIDVVASIDLATAPAGQAYVLLKPKIEAVLTNRSPVREIELETQELFQFASVAMLMLPPADGACVPPFYVTESSSEGDGLAVCSDATLLGGFMTETTPYGEYITIRPGESLTIPVVSEIAPDEWMYPSSDLTEEKAGTITELVNNGKATIALVGDAGTDGVACPNTQDGIRWASTTDLASLCPSLKNR